MLKLLTAALLLVAGPAFAGSMTLLGVGGAGGGARRPERPTMSTLQLALTLIMGHRRPPLGRPFGKVNGATFQPGDSVLFKGGQTFTVGTAVSCGSGGAVTTTALCLTPSKFLGTPAAPVTLGSFGTGTATIQALTTNAGLDGL